MPRRTSENSVGEKFPHKAMTGVFSEDDSRLRKDPCRWFCVVQGPILPSGLGLGILLAVSIAIDFGIWAARCHCWLVQQCSVREIHQNARGTYNFKYNGVFA